ncbi:MAG: hypothetical protein HWD61_03575 [Parachlamydiaceae bacterium]|nr:MAG: hypothetical protein HWD61_03575 [Parachlamydiaceae bacterium]
MIKSLTSQNEIRLSSIKLKEFNIEKKKFNRKIMDLFGGKEEFEKLPLLELENGKTFCMSAPIMRVKFKNIQTKGPHFILRIDYKNEGWRGWTSLFRVDDFGLLAFLPIFEGKDFDLWGHTAPPTYVMHLRTNNDNTDYYEELKSLIANKENKRVIIR